MLYVSSVAHCSAGGLDLFVCWLIFLYFLRVLSCMFLHGVCSITEGGVYLVPGMYHIEKTLTTYSEPEVMGEPYHVCYLISYFCVYPGR